VTIPPAGINLNGVGVILVDFDNATLTPRDHNTTCRLWNFIRFYPNKAAHCLQQVEDVASEYKPADYWNWRLPMPPDYAPYKRHVC
jgi:hypothetical protein